LGPPAQRSSENTLRLLEMKDTMEKISDRMTVILGLLGLLQEGAFGTISERQKGAVTELLATSEELRELLAQSSNGRSRVEQQAH
jgi:hypothetical protein